jgi:tetratricopeptide (TPR) repeat protein
MGPVSLYFVMDQIRLYVPLVGLSLLTSLLLGTLRPKLAWALFIALALLSGVRSTIQNLRYGHAEKIWGDVAHTYPHSGLAWEGLGAVLQSMDRYKEAADAYGEAARVEPGHHIYAVDALYCAFRAGAPPEDLLQQIDRVSTSKLDVRRLVNLAIVEAQVGQTERSEEHFRLAIKTNSQFGLAYLNLAFLLTQLDRRMEAVEMYQKALDLLPGHPAALAGLTKLRSSH